MNFASPRFAAVTGPSGDTADPDSVVVTVTVATGRIYAGGSVGLSATVAGLADARVTWAFSPSGVTFDNGILTASAVTGLFTATATSLAAPTHSGSATVDVAALPTLEPTAEANGTALHLGWPALGFSAFVVTRDDDSTVSVTSPVFDESSDAYGVERCYRVRLVNGAVLGPQSVAHCLKPSSGHQLFALDGNRVLVFDALSNGDVPPVQTIALGPTGFTAKSLTIDGDTAYALSTTGDVVVAAAIDGTTRRSLHFVPLASASRIGVAGEHGELFVAHDGTGPLLRLPTAGSGDVSGEALAHGGLTQAGNGFPLVCPAPQCNVLSLPYEAALGQIGVVTADTTLGLTLAVYPHDASNPLTVAHDPLGYSSAYDTGEPTSVVGSPVVFGGVALAAAGISPSDPGSAYAWNIIALPWNGSATDASYSGALFWNGVTPILTGLTAVSASQFAVTVKQSDASSGMALTPFIATYPLTVSGNGATPLRRLLGGRTQISDATTALFYR